jgi:hypothetical protein
MSTGITPAGATRLALILTFAAIAMLPITFILTFFVPYFSDMHGGPGALIVTAPILGLIFLASLSLAGNRTVRSLGRRMVMLALLPGVTAGVAIVLFALLLFAL